MQWVAGIETEPAYTGLAAGAIAGELDAKGTVTGKAFPRERPVAFVVHSDSG